MSVFRNWHAVCLNLGGMINASTYRQVTMILGVIVAMIILVTLWMRNPESSVATRPALELPSVPKPAAPASLLKLSAKAAGFVKDHF